MNDGMRFTPGAAGGPGAGQMGGQPQQLNIDASVLDTFVCKCGNYLFKNLVIVKKVGATNPINNTGKEMFAPMQVLSCTKCGHIPEEFGGRAVPDVQSGDDE